MAIRKLRNYVRGEWYEPRGARFIDVENPSTGRDDRPGSAVERRRDQRRHRGGRAAFPGWARTPVDKRVAPLFKLAEMIRANREVLARSITEENGKSLTDARAEMDRALENVETACGMPVLQQDKLIGAAPASTRGDPPADGRLRHDRAVQLSRHGAVLVRPYALASGNTYVVKPSKQSPERCSCWRGISTPAVSRGGLQPGERRPRGRRGLHGAPDVQGVWSSASTTARNRRRDCARNNKRFQAMGAPRTISSSCRMPRWTTWCAT